MSKQPKLVSPLFNDQLFNDLKTYLKNMNKDSNTYDPGFGRYAFNDPMIDQYSQMLISKARTEFGSDTLLPTYSLFAHYEGNSSLYFHKDDNACTYTLDMCVYQKEPWGLWVDGKEYILMENEALAYYGNDQEHGRKDFATGNHVAMIFFHFAEPDHWFFTKGPSYLEVIRGHISEEEWQRQR